MKRITLIAAALLIAAATANASIQLHWNGLNGGLGGYYVNPLTNGVGYGLEFSPDNWATEIMNGVIPVLEKDDYIPLTSVHLWDSQRCQARVA